MGFGGGPLYVTYIFWGGAVVWCDVLLVRCFGAVVWCDVDLVQYGVLVR